MRHLLLLAATRTNAARHFDQEMPLILLNLENVSTIILVPVKNINSLGVVLIILIVPLYLIYFTIYLTDKTVNMLIAVAAVVSTLLLYLAFHESKKSNYLKIYESEFDRFDKEIRFFEERSKQKLFSATTDKLIESVFPESIEYLPYITYTNFASMEILLKMIEDNKNNKCLQKMIWKVGNDGMLMDEYIIMDESIIMESKQISILLKEINKGFSNLERSYYNLVSLSYSIDNSSLLKEQKQLLFSRIKPNLDDYDKISNGIGMGGDELCRLLLETNMFEITPTNRLIRGDSLYEGSSFPMLNELLHKIFEAYNYFPSST